MARFKPKYSKKIFPFCPGIAWTIENTHYIIPEVLPTTWEQRVRNANKATVIAYGNLLESFYSLTIIELLKRFNKNIYWIGNERYYNLIKHQSIAKIDKNNYLTEQKANKYPTPIFFDKEGNIYFNCLVNFINKKSYYKEKSKKNRKPVIEQIFENNCLLPWDESYLPKLRSIDECFSNIKYNNHILIIGDIWTEYQIKEFSALMHRFNIKIIVCKHDTSKLYGYRNNLIVGSDYSYDKIIYLIKKAKAIISNEANYILTSLSLFNGVVFTRTNNDKVFDPYKNANFIGAINDIYCSRELTPMEIYSYFEAMHE